MTIVQRKSAAVRREEIVQAALEIMAGQGPGSLTTNAIAESVGVSQAALFKHFSSKSAILMACVDWIGERIRPAVLAAAAQPGTAGERLSRVVHTLLSVARTIPAMPPTMFSRELLAEYPELQKMLRERRSKFLEILEGLLQDGVRSGEFAADLDVSAAAYLTMGMIHSLLFRYRQIDPELDVEHEAEVILHILLNGLNRR